MDSVVRSVVVGVMEIGKTVVLTAGKVIAMGIASIGSAIDSIFSVQRIYYAGSLAACLKGNFGTLEIDATVFSTKVAYARCSSHSPPALTRPLVSLGFRLTVSAHIASSPSRHFDAACAPRTHSAALLRSAWLAALPVAISI
jgi:hypothetical protein